MRLVVDGIHEPSEKNRREFFAVKQYADACHDLLVSKIYSSFVMPVDREDMLSLAHILADILNRAALLIEELSLFGIPSDAPLKEMSITIAGICAEITAALRTVRFQHRESFEHALRIKKTALLIRHMYDQAVGNLNSTRSAVTSLKMQEIYRHCSCVSERGIEAAYVLGDMLVKLA